MLNTTAAEMTREDADIEELIDRGEPKRALNLLMERYGDRVYRFAHAMTRSATAAEDVRQQVFIEAYRDLARFQRRSALRTWLFAIVRNRCLDYTKAQRRWWRRFKNDTPDEPEQEPPDFDRGRIARLLASCLEKLAPAAREAVVLRYIEELAYEDASAITGDLAGTLQQFFESRQLRVPATAGRTAGCAGVGRRQMHRLRLRVRAIIAISHARGCPA
jgi:RNA polymerase sigma-70 factor (ECF subfamily)